MKHLKYLKKIPVFSNLSDKELKKVSNISKICKYKKNSTIMLEGEKGDNIYVIVSGMVKIYKTSSFKSKTLAFLKEGDFFGEMAVIDSENRSASVYVMEDSEFRLISKKEFTKLLKANPEISFKIVKTLCDRIRSANKEIEMLTFQNVLGRLATILLDLCNKHGKEEENGVVININLTHQDLAEMVGTSREVVTRIITNFKKVGCLDMSDHHIIIRNMEKLRNWIN